jgi:transcriptional regulator with XRE-family HTH domain
MNNRIVEIRKSKGITRKQLAAVAGVNFRFLESIEQGRLDLYESSYSRVLAIAKALEVKPEELFSTE